MSMMRALLFLALGTALQAGPLWGQAEDAEPQPGWLGFAFQVESQAQPGEGTSTRLKVCAVAPGSPAAQAGLEPEDRIVALAGKPVPFKDHRAALSYFGRLEVGQRVRLGVLREAESIEVELTAGPLPPGMREVRRRNLELSRESPADPPRH